MIDDRFLHPGDAVDVPGEVDAIAVPLSGPSISFRDAYRMVERSRAAHVVPIHYDGFLANPHRFPDWCDLGQIHVLADEQFVELDLRPR